MRKTLNATDKRILEIASQYVASQLELHRPATEPIDWRNYHEAARVELSKYVKKAS